MDQWTVGLFLQYSLDHFFGPFAEAFFIEILREEWLVLYNSIMDTACEWENAPEA